MVAGPAERLVRAVETLAVDPADGLLEIGCGHGVAVSLVCDRLVGGKITAIDRSAKMIEAARKRNREHIAAGKAELIVAAVDEADFGKEQFDQVFAVNVRSLWDQRASSTSFAAGWRRAGSSLSSTRSPAGAAEGGRDSLPTV